MTSSADTKTIMQFLSENPDVDVSKAWERCWNIHSNIRTDPMNLLPQKIFGAREFNRRLDLRCGVQQMEEARRA